jgi:hypothetical protein
MRAKPAVVNGVLRSLTKTNGEEGLSRCSRRSAPQLIAEQRMGTRGAVLDPAHVEYGTIEVDLVPTQVADFSCPQPMAEGDQDHGRVPVTVAIVLRGLDQGLDLARREMLAGAKLGIRSPGRRNCSENFSRGDQPGCRICQ